MTCPHCGQYAIPWPHLQLADPSRDHWMCLRDGIFSLPRPGAPAPALDDEEPEYPLASAPRVFVQLVLMRGGGVMYRQGDVLVIPVSELPKGLTPVKRDARARIVLAEGEVTGHAHAITAPDAELYADPAATAEAADRYLRIRSTVTLDHEEHGQITLPPGDYIVRRQREWTDADEPRPVLD